MSQREIVRCSARLSRLKHNAEDKRKEATKLLQEIKNLEADLTIEEIRLMHQYKIPLIYVRKPDELTAEGSIIMIHTIDGSSTLNTTIFWQVFSKIEGNFNNGHLLGKTLKEKGSIDKSTEHIIYNSAIIKI